MFTGINYSGVKDSGFNEQLLLAALKMLWLDRGRQTGKGWGGGLLMHRTYRVTV